MVHAHPEAHGHPKGACMLAPFMLAGGPCLGTCVHASQDKVAGGRVAYPSIFIVRVGWFYQPAMLRCTTPLAIGLGLFNNACSYNCHSFPSEQRKLLPPGVPSCTPRSSGGVKLHPGTWGLGGPISQATPFVRRADQASP
jgi:hypothetical protein